MDPVRKKCFMAERRQSAAQQEQQQPPTAALRVLNWRGLVSVCSHRPEDTEKPDDANC
jgi:hypothetical protein